MMRKVFISTFSFGEFDSKPVDILKAVGLEVQSKPYHLTLSKGEIINLGMKSEGPVAKTEALDEEVLEKLKHLPVISCCGAGLDNIDLDVAKKRGVQVFSILCGPILAVVELTVALILSLLRCIPRVDRDIRAGKWQKHMGHLLRGKKVGIIGFGRIRQKVAQLLMGLGVQIAYCGQQLMK